MLNTKEMVLRVEAVRLWGGVHRTDWLDMVSDALADHAAPIDGRAMPPVALILHAYDDQMAMLTEITTLRRELQRIQGCPLCRGHGFVRHQREGGEKINTSCPACNPVRDLGSANPQLPAGLILETALNPPPPGPLQVGQNGHTEQLPEVADGP